MYFVKYGREYLHDPRVDDCLILDLSLTCEENSCGYCDFTIYPSHPLYDKLREHDADNPIEVYDDDVWLFSGSIYELGKEFYLDGHVKCKGELSYLEESIVRPYSTLQKGYGTTVPDTANGYFEWLINQHNAQVSSNKQFTIGINQASSLYPLNYIFRESNEYPKTFDEIKEKLLKFIGGYLVVRHENGVRYIDYLSEWTKSNSQILDFGVNLTDYSQVDDGSEVATFVVPLGARMSDTDYEYDDGYFVTPDATINPNKEYFTQTENGYSRCSDDLAAFEVGVTYYEYNEDEDESGLALTVEAALDGMDYEPDYAKNGDMVYCASAVKKYGWIGCTYKDQDITTREDLIQTGILALKELVSPKRTIEIKAVDMHLINPDILPIRIGEYVRVRSTPHKLDSYFLCVDIDLNLNNPENSIYTLGTTFDTLTGQQNKKINALNETINKQYEEASQISERTNKSLSAITKTANDAKQAADSAVLSVHEEFAVSNSTSDPPQTDWSSSTPQWSEGTFIWRKSVTTYGDGHSEAGSPVLMTGNSGEKGEDATVLRIDSSRGTVFKNSEITTVLTAVIYHGSTRISTLAELHAVFGNSAYLQWSWQRLTDQIFGIISSSDPKLSNDGFALTLTPQDVDTKATFMCELMTS